MSERWYKEAVIYCVEVDTFQDSDGDGCGDLRGLISRLDYLARLGVTCLWLNPIHPTPQRDDGYDVADYYGVDPRLGTLGDFAELTRQARPARHPASCSTSSSTTPPTSTRGSSPRAATRSRRTATGTSGATTSRPTAARASSSPASRPRPGPATSGRRVVLPPLLRLPARPELGQPGGARGDQEGHGLLAAARRVRLPDRRRAVRPRAGQPRTSTRRRWTSRILDDWRQDAAVAHRRRRAAVRGQRRRRTSSPQYCAAAAGRPERPRPHAVRLPAQRQAVAGAGPRRRRAAGRGADARCPSCRRWRSGRRSCATTTSSTSAG